MSNISVITRGFTQLEVRLEKMSAEIEANKVRAARSAANIVRRAIRAEARKIRGTGFAVGYGKRGKVRVRHTLESSIQITPIGVGFAVGPKTPIAHLVIRGHNPPPSPIVPLGASDARSSGGLDRFHLRGFQGPVMAHTALSWSGGGQPIFAASSPGGHAKGNPFVHRALDELTRAEAIAAAKTTLFGGPEASDT